VISPLGTFTKGVPRVSSTRPFTLRIPTIIPPSEAPGTSATYTISLVLSSLPGSRGANAAPGFQVNETLPFTLAYGKTGRPTLVAGTPSVPAPVQPATSFSEAQFTPQLSGAQQTALTANGLGAAAAFINSQSSGSSAQSTQTIQTQIAADCQKDQLERWKILQETQADIFAIQQSVTVGPTSTNNSFPAFDDYIRSFASRPRARLASASCSPPGPFANYKRLSAIVTKVASQPVTRYYVDVSADLAQLVGKTDTALGDMELDIHQAYTDSAGNTLSADATMGVYVDPSGTVETTTGIPLAGATVTLERATRPNGRFTVVPNGSKIMSPDNRRNPIRTGNDGAFDWNVLAAYYRIRVTRPGCHAPGQPRRRFVLTRTFPIPPPVSGIVIKLACPTVRRTASHTILVGIRFAKQRLSLVGALVAPVRGRSLPTGIVTFRSRRRILAILPLTAGTAELLVPSGTIKTVSATYSGDSRYGPSTAKLR
jgi:hypothetical protein